ncbi:MAG: M43 family zinc metalloprotease [Bacteroidota bacterium]
MKKTLLLSLLAIFQLTATQSSHAQKVNRCGVVEHEQWLQNQNPKRASQRERFDQVVNEYANRLISSKTTMPNITIPVVVHLVYKTNAQNISDAQILSQIDVLNQDFNRLNPDTANTPAPFKPIAGIANITFCLATVDPTGNPTTGIERRLTTVNSFNTNDAVKAFSTGGLDAWDPSQYFNIWVCNLGGGLLGYAEFPTNQLSNTYGVVIGYNYFGNIGTLSPPYDLGRTATHEVGHCFNLFHIWGDDGTGCTGSDQCADTPNQADENYTCPGFPSISCNNGPNGDMWMNYMDYSDDACMNMFSAGQVARMLAVVNNGPYSNLQNSAACGSSNLLALDARMMGVDFPTGNICSGTITPVIQLKNQGADTLTSVLITYNIDNGTPQTFNWTGSLASLATTTITLPTITTGGGAHTFYAASSLPNNNPDQDPSNDNTSSNFTVVGVGQPVPFVEGFEATFPNTGAVLNNPDASFTWEQTSAAAHTGTQSIYINNYDYASNGEIDEYILPNLDLTAVGSPKLSFWVAYRLYTNPTANPNYSDTLEVLVSTDCGQTFTSAYKKFSTALVTTPAPFYTTAAFVPTASQWRRDSIDLAPYASFNNVVVKFRSITDYENNLYLDDINIDGTTGLSSQPSLAAVSIYPNPANNYLNIDLTSISSDRNIGIRIVDMTGKTVHATSNNTGGQLLRVETSNISSGLYVVELSGMDGVVRMPFTKK